MYNKQTITRAQKRFIIICDTFYAKHETLRAHIKTTKNFLKCKLFLFFLARGVINIFELIHTEDIYTVQRQ